MSSVVFFLSHLCLFKLVCSVTSGNNPVKTVPQHYADLCKAETRVTAASAEKRYTETQRSLRAASNDLLNILSD